MFYRPFRRLIDALRSLVSTKGVQTLSILWLTWYLFFDSTFVEMMRESREPFRFLIFITLAIIVMTFTHNAYCPCGQWDWRGHVKDEEDEEG